MAVTSSSFTLGSSLGGYASFTLQPQTVELFSSTQGPTGKPGPVNRLGYDVKTGKVY